MFTWCKFLKFPSQLQCFTIIHGAYFSLTGGWVLLQSILFVSSMSLKCSDLVCTCVRMQPPHCNVARHFLFVRSLSALTAAGSAAHFDFIWSTAQNDLNPKWNYSKKECLWEAGLAATLDSETQSEFLPGYFYFLPTMWTFNKTNNKLMSQSGTDMESLEMESFALCVLYSADDRAKLVLNQLSTMASCVFQEMWALFILVICGHPKCIAWLLRDGTGRSSPQMHWTAFVSFSFLCLSSCQVPWDEH